MFFYDYTLISVSIETILSNKDRLFCLPTPGYMWPSVDHYRKWCDRKDICKTDFCRNIDNHNNCRKIDRTGYAIGGIFFTMGLQRSILKGHIKRNVTQQPTQLSYHTTYLFLCVRDIVAYVLLFSPAIYSGLNNLFGRDRFCCTCYFSCVSNYRNHEKH